MNNLWTPLDGVRTQQHKSTTVVCLAVSLCFCAIMACPVAVLAQDEEAPETITSEPMNEDSAAPETTEVPADVNSTQGPATRPRGFG